MNGNPAISHVINPIKALDHSLVMGDHDNGRVLRASEMPEHIHHGFAPLGIECSGCSSAKITAGSLMTARATATLCCSPPDSVAG